MEQVQKLKNLRILHNFDYKLKPNSEIWYFYKKIVKIWLLENKKTHTFLAILKKTISQLAKFSQGKKKKKLLWHFPLAFTLN